MSRRSKLRLLAPAAAVALLAGAVQSPAEPSAHDAIQPSGFRVLGTAEKPRGTVDHSYDHVGHVVGDKESSIRFEISVLRSGSYLLSGFRAKGVPGQCGSRGIIDLRIHGNFFIHADGHFRKRVVNDDGSFLKLSGRVLRGGRKVEAQLLTSPFPDSDDPSVTCQVSRVTFLTEGETTPLCGGVFEVRKAKVCLIPRFDEKGKLEKFGSLAFKNIPVGCERGGSAPVAGRATRVKVLGGGRFKVQHGNIDGPFTQERISLKGVVGSRRRASGMLEISYLTPRGELCASESFKWTTAARDGHES